jgi:beta-lactamase regulating signal transducer with metallopeptidase domain
MLSNAAVAAVLALVALGLACVCRSPAVRHAAWVIVLLKLVTPPLISIPLTVLPASWGPDPEEPPPDRFVLLSPSAPDPGRTATATATATGAIAPSGWRLYRPAGPAEWAVVAWALGALTWFLRHGRRIVRFHRRVARAEDAPPEVSAALVRLASALGITHPPVVKLATGISSPMLWGWGRTATVLFPKDLLTRLSSDARDTLLAHELAHFLRWDHWVRVLEFVATGLFWWHPVVWFARRRIEAVEEECCDSWVVGGLAASPRVYAEALLATVDYEAELRRPRLPPATCAANRSAKLLQRRLLGMIRAGRPYRLRIGGAIWTVVIAVLLIRPVLRAAAPDPIDPITTPVASDPPQPDRPKKPKASAKIPEPRSWATVKDSVGGLTVMARDKELVLRFADGTSRVLGPGRPIALAFAPGGERIATAGPGPQVRTWSTRGDPVATSRCGATARALAYTPDGAQLLVLDAAGEITVLDPQTLAVVASWYVGGPVNTIACAPDCRTVAVSCGSWFGDSGWVECWSISEQRKLVTYPAPAPVGAVRFAPDGQALVIGCWDGRVIWRALPGGELIAESQLSKDTVADTAFCPDAGTLPLEPPAPAPPPDTAPALDWGGPSTFPDR